MPFGGFPALPACLSPSLAAEMFVIRRGVVCSLHMDQKAGETEVNRKSPGVSRDCGTGRGGKSIDFWVFLGCDAFPAPVWLNPQGEHQAGEGILRLCQSHHVPGLWEEIKEVLADDSLASEQKFLKVPF